MLPLNYGTTLVTRDEWGAREPKSIQRLAVGTVTSHWEGPHMGNFSHEQCAGKVRGIQDFHMDSRGWNDIAYNAVACPHGYVFEGRGPGVRSAANGTTAGNQGAYAVCYLGGEGDPFTEGGQRAMKAAGDWLTFPGSERNAHRDWKATQCPGDDIYQWTHAGQPVTWPPPAPPKGRNSSVLDITTAQDGKRQDLVLIGKGNVPWHYWRMHPADTWSPGEQIGTGKVKSITCTWANGRFIVSGQGMNNLPWEVQWSAEDGWGEWAQTPVGAEMLPPAENV